MHIKHIVEPMRHRFAVLRYLQLNGDMMELCTRSFQELADYANCEVRDVEKALNRLSEDGLIHYDLGIVRAL